MKIRGPLIPLIVNGRYTTLNKLVVIAMHRTLYDGGDVSGTPHIDLTAKVSLYGTPRDNGGSPIELIKDYKLNLPSIAYAGKIHVDTIIELNNILEGYSSIFWQYDGGNYLADIMINPISNSNAVINKGINNE